VCFALLLFFTLVLLAFVFAFDVLSHLGMPTSFISSSSSNFISSFGNSTLVRSGKTGQPNPSLTPPKARRGGLARQDYTG